MATKRLYRTDRYLTTNKSTVTAVREKNGFDLITTVESYFYPEGGGQPSDIGKVWLRNVPYAVTHASCEDLESDVWHLTDAPAGTFHEGDAVTLVVDWDFRFRNMQRHCGEHMLSGAMYSLFGGVNKGFHMGDDYTTIDIDLGGRMLTEEELRLAEKTVNDAIWADLPVETLWFDDYESSKVMPVRKAVPHEGRVSVVVVGGPEDPFDCIACCGTHPSSAGQVGLVAIYKCEPNKGMNRIFFDCGSAAFEKLTGDSKLLSDIAKRYSCSPHDLPGRLDIEADNNAALRARLAALSSYVRDNEKAAILRGISEAGSSVFTYYSDLLSTDELLKLGFAVIGEASGQLLALGHPETNTCLLFSSGDVKCGQLIKAHASEYGGRGGGRDDNARAIFATAADMRRFADALPEMI